MSLCSEHLHPVSLALCDAVGDSCTGWISLRPPLCAPTLSESHKSPSFYAASLHPNTHTHALMSSLLLVGRLHPGSIRFLAPPHSSDPLSLQLCVSCQPVWVELEMKPKHTWGLQGRPPGLSVSPSCHSLLRLPLITSFLPLVSPTGSHLQTFLKLNMNKGWSWEMCRFYERCFHSCGAVLKKYPQKTKNTE